MARGIYHGTAARSGDYVMHVHGESRRISVDRVLPGGAHTTIGGGYKNEVEALDWLARNARALKKWHARDAVYLQHGDELVWKRHLRDVIAEQISRAGSREKPGEIVVLDSALKARMSKVLGKR